MHKSLIIRRGVVWSTAAILLAPAVAPAQQGGGTPGSPNATTTIDGRYLPNPTPPFRGVISVNADYPPMQEPASFNLQAVKEKTQKVLRHTTGQ